MSMHFIGMHFISVSIMGVHLEGVNLVSMYHHNFSYNDPRSASTRGVWITNKRYLETCSGPCSNSHQQDLLGLGRNSPTSDTLALNSRIYLPRVTPSLLPLFCHAQPTKSKAYVDAPGLKKRFLLPSVQSLDQVELQS